MRRARKVYECLPNQRREVQQLTQTVENYEVTLYLRYFQLLDFGGLLYYAAAEEENNYGNYNNYRALCDQPDDKRFFFLFSLFVHTNVNQILVIEVLHRGDKAYEQQRQRRPAELELVVVSQRPIVHIIELVPEN